MRTRKRRKSPRRAAQSLRLERLEPRQLLVGNLVISELMARNDNTLLDEDGDSSDWLELVNNGDMAISTDGWYLTDDATNLTKWQLPGVDLAMGEYLVVFASGKDRPIAGFELHANFQLSGNGEFLALVMPDGTTVASQFAPGFPRQAVDVSYGIDESDPMVVRYFTNATPGAANDMGSSLLGLVADTQFSVDRGFFDAPFDVEIMTLTEGAEIRYTLDGDVPNARSPRYTGPITVTTTTTLRAVATKDGFLPTNVDTQTYVFVEDVVQQPTNPAGFPTAWGSAVSVDYEMDPEIVDSPLYRDAVKEGLTAIPTLSLVLPTSEMFGASGLYSNPENTTLETGTSAELIYPDGSNGFQIDAGLKIQGGASRRPERSPKHAMSLRFRDIYGPGTLDFPLFGDSPVTTFDSLQLRAMYNNSWIHWDDAQRPRGSLIRDQWMRDSLLDMGQIDAGRGTYFNLYVNGLYWGVYNVHERQDSAHFAEYFGGTEDDYDARNGGTTIDGTTRSYNTMRSTVASRDWEAIQQVLDVDNYIDFLIIHRFGGNQDLQTGGNWRSAGGGPADAPWRFYSWDSERVLENVNQTNLNPTDDPPDLFSDLVQIPEFVLRFGDRIQKHFFNGGALTPEATAARWQARADELFNAIVGESARWGDYQRDIFRSECPCDLYARDSHWLVEQNRLMNNYFPQRSDVVLNYFRSQGLFPDLAAPQYNQHGGNVAQGFEVSLTGPGAIFYTLDGSDPRAGDPTVEFTTLLPEFAPATALVPTDGALGDSWYMPGFDDSGWINGMTGVGYERSAGYDPLIGVDLETQMYNTRATAYVRVPFTVDDPSTFDSLTLRMKYDDGFVAYLNGQRVAGRNDPAALDWQSEATQGHADSAATVFENIDISEFLGLLQPGENLLAIHGLNDGDNSSDFLILPELAGGVTSGMGLSPTAVRFTEPFALNTSTIVRARVLNGGNWSPLAEATFIVDLPPVRISELMYHPADPEPGSPFDDNDFEYVELVNIGDSTIDLTSLRMTTGVVFDFSTSAITTLEAGQHILIVSNRQAFESRYGAGKPIAGEYTGLLNNGGERLVLGDDFGATILDFAYDDNWFPETDGGGHSLVIVDDGIDAGDWGLMESWRASFQPGGSPGGVDNQRIPGDANGDGVVNIDDLNAVRNNFGAVGNGVPGDTNGDGVVNIDDLNAVRNNFGAGNPALPALLQAPRVESAVAKRLVRFDNAADRIAEPQRETVRQEETSPSPVDRPFRQLARVARGHRLSVRAAMETWDLALEELTIQPPD